MSAAPIKTRDLAVELAKAKGRERSLFEEVLRSRRIAWAAATASFALTVGTVGFAGVYMVVHSKPVTPVVMMVDKITGKAEILNTAGPRDSYGVEADSREVVQYVMSRENYDWQTIQKDYNDTVKRSSAEEARRYSQQFGGETGRDKVLADKTRILVEIESAPIIDPATHTATVRFKTTDRGNNRPDVEQHWIATLAYSYLGAAADANEAMVNPFGFQVRSYRADKDLLGGRS